MVFPGGYALELTCELCDLVVTDQVVVKLSDYSFLPHFFPASDCSNKMEALKPSCCRTEVTAAVCWRCVLTVEPCAGN